MDAHKIAAASVAEQTRHFYKLQQPFRVYHGATNSTRTAKRAADRIVDTSRLTHILDVDTSRKTALVEANVPMDALVEATLKHGLVPLVVMEFPGITVGGGFSGTSGESSSFLYGTFDATINWIEIVLANGEIATASKTEKPDLFWGAASAFGTLGTVTLLEVQLRDARKYVQLDYHHASSVKEALALLKAETFKEATDYVDAIMYSEDSTIICSGRLVDNIPDESPPCQFLRMRDPWFSVHAEKVQKRLKNGSPTTITDFVPLRDYLFRYDRGGFWVARYAFKYFLTPFNRITRVLLDPFLHARPMYHALHQSSLADFYVIQDVGIPFEKAEELAHWLDEHLMIYPLWLLPGCVRRFSPNSNHGLNADWGTPAAPDFLNFGVWGPVPGDRREAVRLNRALEQKVLELGGKKALYAHAYYTEDEFWAHYDRRSYDALRAKYSATYLPTVYDKVKVDVEAEEAVLRASWAAWLRARFWSVWPLSGLYGVYKVILGGDYLLQKKTGTVPKALKAE